MNNVATLNTSANIPYRYSDRYSTDIKGGHLWPFIIKTALCVILFYILCGYVNKNDAETSLWQSILLGGVVVYIYSTLLIRRTSWSAIMLGIYFLKCGIGVFHYLTFVDPLYFYHPASIHLTAVGDYINMFEQVNIFATKCWGGSATMKSLTFMPHPELYWLIGGIFNKIGCYFLSIVPVNGVVSMMMAVMIGYITKLRKGNYGIALILAGLFPLSLLTSFFFRDMMGMMLATFGMTCIILAKKHIWIWLIVASYLFYLQRTVYCVLPILAYFIYTYFQNKSLNNNKNGFLVVAVLAVVGVASFFSSLLFEGNEGYMSNLNNILLYILFPVRYIMCIIGPFPWTNTFLSPEKTYYLQFSR